MFIGTYSRNLICFRFVRLDPDEFFSADVRQMCKYSVSFVLLETDFVDTFTGVPVISDSGNGVCGCGRVPCVKNQMFFVQVVSLHDLLKTVTACSDSVIIIGLI